MRISIYPVINGHFVNYCLVNNMVSDVNELEIDTVCNVTIRVIKMVSEKLWRCILKRNNFNRVHEDL